MDLKITCDAKQILILIPASQSDIPGKKFSVTFYTD